MRANKKEKKTRTKQTKQAPALAVSLGVQGGFAAQAARAGA